ncbi:uncharacterized protein LOC134012033 [Osmerus eperlanus]|uniref:uncharacterized protein LOC134012033 n=1 Tax=Osmerus eperlanus TaxID=29151 RepID=UPI002E156DE6
MAGKYLLHEGFLKKRKDILKLTWATYWFRLQNTTLFFYTKKDGSALHLRGLYYIYTVQSVREVQKEGTKHYVFEITMTNGRKKVLAAETAALRTEWIRHLWRAMHMTSPGGTDPGSSWQEECDCIYDSPVSAHPLSYEDQDQDQDQDQDHDQDQGNWSLSVSSYEGLSNEEAIYQNTVSSHISFSDERDHHCRLDLPRGSCEQTTEVVEGVYDVLPARNSSYQINQSRPDMTQRESLYDVPLNNRRASERRAYRAEVTESVYDVPNSLLRKRSEYTSEPHSGKEPQAVGHLEDMMACLGVDRRPSGGGPGGPGRDAM